MGLSFVIHGESGTGKSTLSESAPGPRLYLDVEGGARLLENEFVLWDGKSAPPQVEGNVNVIVDVFDWATVDKVLQWLQSGKHPFRSVVVDSLTELQKRLIDSIAGLNPMQTQDWGTALREMEFKVRSLKDLTRNPHKPLDAVVIVCASQDKDEKTKPLLQGQIVGTLPYYVDVVGYTTLHATDAGLEQTLQVFPLNNIVAKGRGVAGKRLLQKYGAFIANPSLARMIDVVENKNQESVA